MEDSRFFVYDEDWDAMSMNEIVEFFKDKNFFHRCRSSCPKWNRMLKRVIKEFGEVYPDPVGGFGLCKKHHQPYPPPKKIEQLEIKWI